MDRNSWLGLVLIVGVMLAWGYFTKPSEQELADKQRKQDSIESVRQRQALKEIEMQNQTSQAPVIGVAEEKSNEQVASDMQQLYGDFSSFAQGDREFKTVETDLLKIQFLNQGGRIYSVELKDYKTHDGKALVLFSGDSTEFGLNFFAHNRSIATNQLFFELTEGNNAKYAKEKSIIIKYTLPIAEGKFIEYKYEIAPDSYVVDFDIQFEGVNELVSSNTGYLSLDWKSYIKAQEKGRTMEEQSTTIYYKYFESDVESISARSEEGQDDLTTPVKWVSYKQQFFNVALIADNSFSNAVVKSKTESVNLKYLKYFSSAISLAYDGKRSESFPMSFYFGPNHYKTLKKLDIDLEKVIELGWNIIRWVNVGLVIPIFNWLGKYIENYGLIILLLTLIIKVLIFPFTYKSFMSTAKMKALKPEIDKVTAKFTKSEDAMKKQQATMALYKKVGVSPMGGCLPMLFQMPILVAMFRFFPNSIELRQQSFLWATDLSTYDAVIHLPFTVPFGFGNHISLFCLLMTIVNVVYMKFNDQMSMTNQSMPGMKMMMYMMPLMMLFWFNSYASALSYYYFLSLLITIIQTWLIRRSVNDEEILAKLKAAQANKKPAKKSKWQQRMEDMAKQRGIAPPKK
ncbi:MAG: membrane protein insertase YidC [Salinivirgaceae bacterium]|jgi:YidC/Oxa1 family membrane protein insertase|nr:membrane protein insertase YidC [Salinivirgaceae bacterium]